MDGNSSEHGHHRSLEGDELNRYVSNLPDGVNKIKIREIFKVFGKVVDIYIGRKRDRSGSLLTFVRFNGVRDAKSLEQDMNRVRCDHCILKVNIARYQK
ncbi:unnamed protein product [Lactuca virosa]|uniref:RRM domain-containing protein n=1 Tax=Lactuca virosa TaxID=75947 RepID=A0AAU9NGB2_9ASTR|nr:unnamed protein product [Lactuca virosa]